MNLSEAIRSRRKSMGLSQSQLAERTGVGRVRISEWELGETPGIEARNLAKLEKALQFEPGELFLIYRAANELEKDEKSPSLNMLQKLAAALGVTPNELLGVGDEKNLGIS